MTLQVHQLAVSLSPCANSKKNCCKLSNTFCPKIPRLSCVVTLFRLEFVPLCYLPPGAGLYLLPVVEGAALAPLPAQVQPTNHLNKNIPTANNISASHSNPPQSARTSYLQRKFSRIFFLIIVYFCRWRLCVFSPKRKLVLFHLSSSDEAKILMNCRLRKLL